VTQSANFQRQSPIPASESVSREQNTARLAVKVDPMTTKLHGLAPRTLLGGLLAAGFAQAAFAAELHSVVVDRTAEKIIVTGSGFDGATTLKLGGVDMTSINALSATQLELPFNAEVASALFSRGSFKLVADGTVSMSVYISEPVQVTAPPPPPPPPGGTTCPCADDWNAKPELLYEYSAFCGTVTDGTQETTYGYGSNYFIAAAFDPNNIFFDPGNPGNSVSYCVLQEGSTFTVSEPVVNQAEYDDCYHWIWRKVCF